MKGSGVTAVLRSIHRSIFRRLVQITSTQEHMSDLDLARRLLSAGNYEALEAL